MKAYCAAWWLIWSVVIVAAVWVACLAWTPAVAASTFVAGAVTTWLAAMLRDRSRFGAPEHRGFGDSARIGAWGGVVILAGASLVDAVGALACALFLLAASTSPVAVQWAWRRLRAARKRHTDRRLRLTLDAAVEERAWDQILTGTLTQMSDVELCWAWRTSYRALGESADIVWWDQVARVRQAYLAELERRHPEKVAAWLATGPRAAAGPERFLRFPAHGETPPG